MNTDWEQLRDIPRSCTCAWEWHTARRVYLLISVNAGCPWHTKGDNS